MMRSGLRRNRSASSPPSSSGSELPEITTTARQQRITRNQGGQSRKRKRARPNDDEENEDDLDLGDDHDDEDENDLSERPNLSNFCKLGCEWGMPRAEERLSSLNLPKTNRLSASGLFEAQSLQSEYELDKTMLCIVLKCSRRVLDEALLESPLAREPNMYTNYQTYSLVATTTIMPPKGVSIGFKERNAIVGSTWSNYEKEEQEVFTPQLFERPLSQEDLDKYVPVFKRLVNITKVSHDLYQGRLWRHSGKSKSRSLEKMMTLEISKIIRHAPNHMRSKPHEPKPMSEGAARQAQRRTELASALNDLIAPYLRGGYTGRGDAHPKVPNLKAGFEEKTFRGRVKLTFNCTPQSRITELMISKGPGHLSNDEVDIWIDDIKKKNYTIIPVRVSDVEGDGPDDDSTTGHNNAQINSAEIRVPNDPDQSLLAEL
ncbi:uncharacterized protein MELLADRAFT_114273 [Melampsora larici-populina 98AG31]|uniref:Uncharacterized protein n=1 Tax=Melampsora larici-populina (strain 98AG31 / pathotype 3-4-7) TaxID=747676 RepID=F4SCV5_MELLP|nr:uncharacterized protein MELLADRAFT_114273 [Melampsora larici-populina 98AG31]EGF97516.1 hypothetical protein MELLADRAFT_114273 [Melampsora larici-populina 98AG31]